MKPLLLALLLALPVVVYNHLSLDAVDSGDAVPATKTDTAPAVRPTHATATPSAPAAAKPASTARLPANSKPWFM
jgi:hypothetical protein